MKRIHPTILTRFLIAMALCFAVSSPSNAQMEKNSFCPVMPGTRVKEKLYLDYEGSRIHFCCKSCVKAFKKHPEKYLKRMERWQKISSPTLN